MGDHAEWKNCHLEGGQLRDADLLEEVAGGECRARPRKSIAGENGVTTKTIGRPPITERQVIVLRECYDENLPTGVASHCAGTHRNTAINYYRHFAAADLLLCLRLQKLKMFSATKAGKA